MYKFCSSGLEFVKMFYNHLMHLIIVIPNLTSFSQAIKVQIKKISE